MKKAFLALASLLLVAASLTACGEDGTSSSSGSSSTVSSSASSGASAATTGSKELDKAIKANPDIKSGATVSTFVDQEGNERFEYKNPDGGGGGGVILD